MVLWVPSRHSALSQLTMLENQTEAMYVPHEGNVGRHAYVFDVSSSVLSYEDTIEEEPYIPFLNASTLEIAKDMLSLYFLSR